MEFSCYHNYKRHFVAINWRNQYFSYFALPRGRAVSKDKVIKINQHKNMNGLFTFIPNEKYHEVQKHLSLSEFGDVPEIDKAEAFESMGIVEFYNGEIDKAALHLKKSLEFTSVARKRKPRRLGITNLLVRLFPSVFRF
jgi:hypothetical protein